MGDFSQTKIDIKGLDYSGNTSIDFKGAGAEVVALFEQGIRMLSAGAYSSAIEIYAQTVALCPECADLWERLGTSYRDHKDFKKADICFARAHQLDEGNFFVLFHWAVAKTDAHAYEEAAALYGQSCSLRPDNAKAHFNLAECYRQLQRPKEWRVEIDEALKLDPSMWNSLPPSFKAHLKGHS